MPVKAGIVSIARGSLHDGDGVRTVVYLKGCPLHCLWCHNPEGLSPKPQLLFAATKCIHCGICAGICPEHHAIIDDRMVYRRDGCTVCGKCAEACPATALEVCGAERSPEDVLAEIMKDSAYYEFSGGGVTFSGGECLLYPEFVAEAATLCQSAGIRTAVETSLFVPWQNIEEVRTHISVFIADIKHMSDAEHKKYTGCGNTLILENLRRLTALHRDILIRVPLIPSVNDSLDNLISTVRFAASLGPSVRGVELLKYNPLARSKYNMVGLPYSAFADEPQDNACMKALCAELRPESPRDGFVFFTK